MKVIKEGIVEKKKVVPPIEGSIELPKKFVGTEVRCYNCGAKFEMEEKDRCYDIGHNHDVLFYTRCPHCGGNGRNDMCIGDDR